MKAMIIGGGKVGSFIADFLQKEGHSVLIIEERREELERLYAEVGEQNVVLGSGTDPVVLESSGIHQMDVVAAVTGKDEVNLVAASLARFEFNIPRVIARVNNPKNAWMFTDDMGVDAALNQAELIGHLILEEMSLGDMVPLLKLRKGQYSIIEEKVDPRSVMVGKRIEQIKLPDQCVLIALLRKDDLIIPHGKVEINPADEIIALAHSSQLDELAGILGPAGENKAN
jgi:trk system potassium uptake protein TrkA